MPIVYKDIPNYICLSEEILVTERASRDSFRPLKKYYVKTSFFARDQRAFKLCPQVKQRERKGREREREKEKEREREKKKEIENDREEREERKNMEKYGKICKRRT